MASSMFSPVLNKGREPLTMIYDHPFGPNEKGVSKIFFATELLV
jgi:insulysin